MGPPSYMRSVVDQNVFLRRITVYTCNFRVRTKKTKEYLKSSEILHIKYTEGTMSA
jgi:hypothetical protein